MGFNCLFKSPILSLSWETKDWATMLHTARKARERCGYFLRERRFQMKRAIVLAMALSLGLSLVLIEKAQADPAKGKAAFATYCASCHGNAGKGDGPAGA